MRSPIQVVTLYAKYPHPRPSTPTNYPSPDRYANTAHRFPQTKMSSDTKSLKIGLALLAPVLALFIALAIIVSVRASVHTSPSPETLQATTTPTLEAQITASITHNSASGIVNALASACTQRIALHFDESSADAILTRAPPSDLYKGIALLKKDCPTSPAIPILLRAYLPRAITDHDTTPATAKLVTDFPETAPPPIFRRCSR